MSSPFCASTRSSFSRYSLTIFSVNNTGHLLSFINLEYLQHRLVHSDERHRIHPCFILSALAMAKLMKSSTVEGGSNGLQESMLLALDAHTAFEEAIHRNWIDHTIAETALVSPQAPASPQR